MRLRNTAVSMVAAALLLLSSTAVYADQQWSLDEPEPVSSIAVIEDGSRIAVGSYGAKAYVFDNQGNKLFTADARNVVTGVDLLRDGRLLVSSGDRHLYMFDKEGKRVWDYDVKKQVNQISATSDGSLIVIFQQGGSEVVFVDPSSGKPVNQTDVGIAINSLRVSGNGMFIAAGAADQYAYVLDPEGRIIQKMGVDGTIQAVAVSDDGQVIVGTSRSQFVSFGPDGKTIYQASVKDTVTSVSVSRKGDLIAVADYSGNIYVYDDSGHKLWETKVKDAARSVAFDREGTELYAGTDKGDIYQYDTGTVIHQARSQADLRTRISFAVGAVLIAAIGFLLYGMKKTKRLGLCAAIWKARLIYLGLAPSFTLIFLFLYYPAFSGLFHSLYDWNPGGRTVFVGLDNFRRMFEDPYIKKGIGNLGLLVATGLIKTLLPPLIAAELIYHLRSKRSQYWIRTLFAASMVVPVVALFLVWQNLYDPNLGLINNLLETIGLASFQHAWLGDPQTALGAVILIGFPFIGVLQLLVFYSGLISIPEEMIESAKMDGAGFIRIIRSIHLPLLAGQFKLLIILAFINIIQDFGGILIVTGGGPMDSTYVPALQMFYAATRFGDLGYASALGVGMFVVIMLITIVNMRFIKTAQD